MFDRCHERPTNEIEAMTGLSVPASSVRLDDFRDKALLRSAELHTYTRAKYARSSDEGKISSQMKCEMRKIARYECRCDTVRYGTRHFVIYSAVYLQELHKSHSGAESISCNHIGFNIPHCTADL